MAPSRFQSSKETTNGLKLIWLIVDGGTEALRNIFLNIHPGNLQHVLATHHPTLLSLFRTKKIITQPQWDKLYPHPPRIPDIQEFEISILFLLLRNICSLSAPSTGWNAMPSSTDKSREADIVRIRFFRNYYFGNLPGIAVSRLDFEARWVEVSSTLVRLGFSQVEIDRLKAEEYDSDGINLDPQEEPTKDSPDSWEWKRISVIHRVKLEKLLEYGRHSPQKVREIHDIRVCFEKEFLIKRGSDGTGVFVGLSKDGCERAVKRLARDDNICSSLAEQEKEILNERNAIESRHVVNYRFLDKSKSDSLFLIMDLYEETLEEFVHRSSHDDWPTIVRDTIHQLLRGLADIHQGPRSIIHGDLKPSNILRDVYGNWLLAEFGVSKILTSGESTIRTKKNGTYHWRAIESCSFFEANNEVLWKKKSDIQVAGMVVFYVWTKGRHPFGEETDQRRNLLAGNPVYLNMVKDPAANDLISWMLQHDPDDRPSAEEALKHPYLQSAKQKFKMLCEVANQPEIKTEDVKSDVVQMLNSDPKDWRCRIPPDILAYLSTDSLNCRRYRYGLSWTQCLRFIRNVAAHWRDRPTPRPEEFYIVGDPQEYFLDVFRNLPTNVHRILRSSDWKERPELREYFSCVSDTASPHPVESTRDNTSTHEEKSFTPQSQLLLKTPDFGRTRSTPTQENQPTKTTSSSEVQETESKEECPLQDEKEIRQQFKDIFIDSKHKLKQEVHGELRRFPWLSGAYGLTAPTKKIARPHIYLTVKKGMKNSDVRRDLEDKFKCEANLHFELLPEPERKPNIQYLGISKSKLRAKLKNSSSLRPAPGGGVLACDRNNCNNSNPLHMLEQNEGQDLPVEQGAGTLTMFCTCDNEHYALTCFHVGCATDENELNATINKKEDIQAIRNSIPTYVNHAKEQQYYFTEKVVENGTDDDRKYTPLGDFHKHHFDNTCDIMSLKVPQSTKIDCKIANATPPRWDDIGQELFERVYERVNKVNVEKTGFSSGVTSGRIIPCDWSNNLETESLFQDAYVIKGYSGPFLEGGDSGSSVFFYDTNDEKQVFAYAVCEIDEIPKIEWPADGGDNDSENGSNDFEIKFKEESAREVTGPYYICLRLDTALENLGLHEAICLNKCSL